MIDPKDIFNAHRVVQSPDVFRRKIARKPLLPHPPALRDPQRRGVTVRSVRAAAQAQLDTARRIARNTDIRIRKR